MNKKFDWRGFSYLLLLMAATIFLIVWWSELTKLWRDHLNTFLFATSIMAIGTVVQARNFISFIPIKHHIKLWPMSRIWAISTLVNYLGPFQPGIAVRVTYLKKNEVSLGSSLIATTRQSIISIWLSFAGFAFGAWLHGDPRVRNLAIILGITFLFLPLFRNLIIKLLNFISRPKFLLHRDLIINVISNATAHGVVGVVAQYCLGTILLFIVYSRFGADIDFGHALLMTCAIYISSLIALAPGNLGVTEAIYVVSGHQLGMSTGDAIALAFLLRGANIFSCFLLSLIIPRKIE